MSIIIAEPVEDKTDTIYRFPNNTTPRTPYQPTGNLAGYHKVEEDYRYSLKHVTLFDGDHETIITVDDSEYDYRDAEHSSPHVARTIGEHPGLDTDALYHAPIEHDWRLKWKAWRNEPEPGLYATVVKGRRKGEHGTVTRVYPIRNVYGAWVADYVELDNGTRTNANNCEYENKGAIMTEKITCTEEEIRNVVQTIYDMAILGCSWKDEDVAEAVVESLREGLDHDQMWDRYGNWYC